VNVEHIPETTGAGGICLRASPQGRRKKNATGEKGPFSLSPSISLLLPELRKSCRVAGEILRWLAALCPGDQGVHTCTLPSIKQASLVAIGCSLQKPPFLSHYFIPFYIPNTNLNLRHVIGKSLSAEQTGCPGSPPSFLLILPSPHTELGDGDWKRGSGHGNWRWCVGFLSPALAR
jgi:hypothetical protein